MPQAATAAISASPRNKPYAPKKSEHSIMTPTAFPCYHRVGMRYNTQLRFSFAILRNSASILAPPRVAVFRCCLRGLRRRSCLPSVVLARPCQEWQIRAPLRHRDYHEQVPKSRTDKQLRTLDEKAVSILSGMSFALTVPVVQTDEILVNEETPWIGDWRAERCPSDVVRPVPTPAGCGAGRRGCGFARIVPMRPAS